MRVAICAELGLGLRPSEPYDPLFGCSRAAPLYSLGLSGAAAFWVARVA
jgi:hypothetical protein